MKKVTKDFTQVPATLLSRSCQDLIADALKTKGQHKFNGNVYGSPAVRQQLDHIYHKKCAFCESNTRAGAPMQVEHYRPKAKVLEEGNHPGYYWLGYEWSNLLLSCATCNRKKWNHFALHAGAVHQPRPPMRGGSLDKKRCLATTRRLVAEQAKLLNPEVEQNVRQHFDYDHTGQIRGVTPQGVYTVTCAGLDRQPLDVARKKLLDNCTLMILRAIDRHERGFSTLSGLRSAIVTAFDYLLTIYLHQEPYSEYAFHCWHRVPAYLIQPLLPQFQPVAQQAYQEVQLAYGNPVV